MFFLQNSTATETTVEAQTATETTVESDDSDTADDLAENEQLTCWITINVILTSTG